MIKKPTKKEIENISIKRRPQLFIPADIHRKISFLCASINSVEWSGILLYTAEGDLNEIDKIKFVIKDVYLMDIGSSAHTSFNYSAEDVSNMFLDNPIYMQEGYKMGLIHSHVNMGVFFSGEDISELKDNTRNHAYYLSLIVNNKGNFCAKLAFSGKQKIKKEVERSFLINLKDWISQKEDVESEEEVIFTADCDIFIDDPFPDYTKRIEDIKKRKEKEIKQYYPSSYSKNGYAGYSQRETELKKGYGKTYEMFPDDYGDEDAFGYPYPVVTADTIKKSDKKEEKSKESYPKIKPPSSINNIESFILLLFTEDTQTESSPSLHDFLIESNSIWKEEEKDEILQFIMDIISDGNFHEGIFVFKTYKQGLSPFISYHSTEDRRDFLDFFKDVIGHLRLQKVTNKKLENNLFLGCLIESFEEVFTFEWEDLEETIAEEKKRYHDRTF